MQFSEAKYTIIVVANMPPQLREKLIAQDCIDLTQLATKITKIMQFIVEKKQRKAS